LKYLVDTNVISELRKGTRCDKNVWEWFSRIADEDIFLSVLTIGEILRGIERIRRRDLQAAGALERWLEERARFYQERILPVSREVAERWGRLGVPDPGPVLDGLIAATASVHGLTVATRNVADIARTGVPCVNPFAGSDSIREKPSEYGRRPAKQSQKISRKSLRPRKTASGSG
jgi:predicted nucleic acid-binding protein